MKWLGRIHWTVYAVGVLLLVSVVVVTREVILTRKVMRLERAVNEAGGFVMNDFKIKIPSGFNGEYFGYYEPIAVQISSGSHPIPGELDLLEELPSITSLSLNTNVVGDHLLDRFSKFRHLHHFDVSDSEISVKGIEYILDTLPNLKVVFVGDDDLTENDLKQLREKYPGKIGLTHAPIP